MRISIKVSKETYKHLVSLKETNGFKTIDETIRFLIMFYRDYNTSWRELLDLKKAIEDLKKSLLRDKIKK